MYMATNIVPTNVNYNSSVLQQNLYNLLITFPFINLQIIGNSVLGKPIYAIKLGNGSNKVLYSASFHANEWITSVILMKFIEDFANAYVNDGFLCNESIRSIFSSSSNSLIPMVNPDGVDLVTNSLQNNVSAYRAARFIANDFPYIPFPSGWKANIRGVDLKNYQPFCKVL